MKAEAEKKHYEVVVTAFATVVVESAENEEQAMQYALNELSMGDMQMDEARIERTITDGELESAKRNADAVAESEDYDDE